jgi:hypothetical protein
LKKILIITTIAIGTIVLVLIITGCTSKKNHSNVLSSSSFINSNSNSNESIISTDYTKELTSVTDKTVSKSTNQSSSASTSIGSPKSSSTKSSTPVISADKRKTTGDGKKLSFNKGDTVLGAAIIINGKTFINCVIKNAPMSGSVTSGVINPWTSEMNGLTVISDSEILSAPTSATSSSTLSSSSLSSSSTPASSSSSTSSTKTRIPTGVGQTKSFQIGDTVVGFTITINGKTFNDPNGVVITNAPFAGIVTDGVINPWSTEITNQKVINDQI